MSFGQRYSIAFEGTGEIAIVDRLRGVRHYTQSVGVDDDDLRYEGVRLVVPYLLTTDTPSVPVTWPVIKPIEKAHRIVIIVVPADMAEHESLRRSLEEYRLLVLEALNRKLLPVYVRCDANIDGASVAIAALNSLASSGIEASERCEAALDDDISRLFQLSLVDAESRSKLSTIAARRYQEKNYGKKCAASFIEYYADNSLETVIERARNVGATSISGECLAGVLCDAIDRGRPLSAIRVGEGEGCFLSYKKYLLDRSPTNEVFGICGKDIYRVWFERDIHQAPISEIETLTKLLGDALGEADIIGVPTVDRVLYEYAHFVHEIRQYGRSRGYVGVSEILKFMIELRHLDTLGGKTITDCDIARPLYEWQDWRQALAVTLPRILKGRRNVTVVTCYDRLAEALKSFLGIDRINTLRVPPERGRLKGTSYLEGDHFQDYFNVICDSLSHNSAPIVLVAAGFLGKHYCAVARRAGSVAIDIGSLADYWAGVNTRAKNAWTIASPFF